MLLPKVRELYRSDVARYTKDVEHERRTLEVHIRKLEEKEVNLWGAFTNHGMRPQIYEQLTREVREERDKVEILLERLKAEQEHSIADLDAASQVLAEIGERYVKCSPDLQRAVLLQMVERVILTAEGQV